MLDDYVINSSLLISLMLCIGASDDAVSCSVLLEALHSMSNSSTPLRHAVIFLFNGAEENILQVRALQATLESRLSLLGVTLIEIWVQALAQIRCAIFWLQIIIQEKDCLGNY